MTDAEEIQALRAEVESLRAEVATLRTQLPQVQGALPCTCGSTAGCQAHPRPWVGTVWCSPQNAWGANAAAGAWAGQTYTVLPTDHLKIECNTIGAAAPPTSAIIFNG